MCAFDMFSIRGNLIKSQYERCFKFYVVLIQSTTNTSIFNVKHKVNPT